MKIKLYDLSIPSYSKCYLFRDFPSMSRTCICFLLTLSLHLFYSPLLCVSSTHIVGSLMPKLFEDKHIIVSHMVIDDDQMWSSLQHRLSQTTKHCRLCRRMALTETRDGMVPASKETLEWTLLCYVVYSFRCTKIIRNMCISYIIILT